MAQRNQQDQSVALFALAHAAAHSPVWDGSDLASLLCTCTGAATALPGTALRVVLKSQQHAESFTRWLSTHGSLCSGLLIKLDEDIEPEWSSLEGGGEIVSYGNVHYAVAAALTQALQANSLSHLLSFTCCHVCPTEALLQVLPTSLTQLHLSYQTTNRSQEPGPEDWLGEDAEEQYDSEDEGWEQNPFPKLQDFMWQDWVTPLVDGLGRLTGLRSLTLDVDINCITANGFGAKYADNSAILRAVSPLTLLTELRLPNTLFEDLRATPESILQLPTSLQSLQVHESRTYRGRGQRLRVSLSHLSALTRLDLGDCYITTAVAAPTSSNGKPPLLPPSIRHIGCTCSHGGGCDLAVLKALPALEHLEPTYSVDDLVELAAGLGRSQLTHVELSFCINKEHRRHSCFGLAAAVDSLEAASVADAVRIVQLSADSSLAVRPRELHQLARLRNLNLLRLSHCKFNTDGLSALSCLTVLTALDLDKYHVWSKDQLLQQLPAVLGQMPALRELEVPNWCTLDDKLSVAEHQAFRSRLEGLSHLTCVGW